MRTRGKSSGRGETAVALGYRLKGHAKELVRYHPVRGFRDGVLYASTIHTHMSKGRVISVTVVTGVM